MVANESYDFAVALLFAGFGTVNPDNIQKYQQPWEYPRISTTQEYQQCTLFPVQCTGSFIFGAYLHLYKKAKEDKNSWRDKKTATLKMT